MLHRDGTVLGIATCRAAYINDHGVKVCEQHQTSFDTQNNLVTSSVVSVVENVTLLDGREAIFFQLYRTELIYGTLP